LESLIDQISQVSHFKNFPRFALKDIVFAGQVRQYPAETIIFSEGEPSAGMHVLISGQVRLTKIGLQGIESIIYILKSVVMFNEITAIDGQPNPVTAITDLDTTTWQISTEKFQILMSRYQELGIGLLRILAARNRVLMNRIEDLMSRSVLARTAKILIAMSHGDQHIINRHEHTNRRLAAMAATVPEAFSRSLKYLKDEGVIDCTRSYIKIHSRDELLKHAQAEPMHLEYSNR